MNRTILTFLNTAEIFVILNLIIFMINIQETVKINNTNNM